MIYWFYFQLPTFQVFLTLNKYWTAAFLTLSVLIATLTVFFSFLSVPINTSANSPLPRRLPICKYRLSSSFAKSWTASSTAWYVVGSRYNCFPTLQNLFPKLTTRIMKSYTRKVIKFSHSHKTKNSQKQVLVKKAEHFMLFSVISHLAKYLTVPRSFWYYWPFWKTNTVYIQRQPMEYVLQNSKPEKFCNIHSKKKLWCSMLYNKITT